MKKFVISCTSTPKRIGFCEPMVRSLCEQSVSPDRILFWYEGEPSTVPAYFKKYPIEVHYCQDYGPAKKLLPTLLMYKDKPETRIVTADDDVIYDRNWVQSFIEADLLEPDTAHAFAVRHIKYYDDGSLKPYNTFTKYPFVDELFAKTIAYTIGHKVSQALSPNYNSVNALHPLMPIGSHGVSYKPKFFTEAYYDWQTQKSTCFYNDDLWNTAHLIANNIPVRLLDSRHIYFRSISTIPHDLRLWTKNKNRNDSALKALFDLGYFHKD